MWKNQNQSRFFETKIPDILTYFLNREIVSDKPLKLESPGRVTLGVCLTNYCSQQSLVPNVLTF